MALQFKDAEVAKVFEATTDKDVKKYITGYHGMLSKVDMKGAEALVNAQDPHIKRKAAETPPVKTK